MGNRDTSRNTEHSRMTSDGLIDCSCEGEILPPDYQKWLDEQESTVEEKDEMLRILNQIEGVF